MRVYLMRHASASDPASGADALRPLTEEGRREAREAGEALQERGCAPTVILTSPRLRARETAELVAAALGGKVPVEVRESLNCGATAAAYFSELRPIDGGDVVVVGHNPEISAISAAWTGDGVSFRPSTICCVDLDGDSGRLDWIRHPSSNP